MASSGHTGFKRLVKAAGYSWHGLCSTFKHESAFRQELAISVVVTPLALWLGDDAVSRALMIGSVFMVLVVELLNSAIEAAIDRVGNEHHLLSARAKDMGSAAVLVAIVNAAIIWLLLLT